MLLNNVLFYFFGNILVLQINEGGRKMYYQNGNYMQDLNYYNQTPNMGYNPYVTNHSNQNMNGMMNPNPMQVPQPNLNAMYPAVYRIISPVVAQVLANNNVGYLTEENLNNMVDTVYNIVEGDIPMRNNNNATQNTTSNSTNENSNASNCERNSSTPRQSTGTTANSRTNSQNELLRDLIKIMILNEINNRRQNNCNPMMMQNNMPNANMSQPMFL